MNDAKPGLGLGQVFTMTVGTIIGIGWITMLGSWLQQAGSLGAMLAFAGGTVVILPIAFCYAELAAAIPVAGGESAWLRSVAGPRAGFAAGWLLLLTFLSVIAFEAISTGWVLAAMFPVLGTVAPVTWAGHVFRPAEIGIGLTGTVLIVVVNLAGSRSFGRLQDGATYGKLVVSALFIVAGLVWGDVSNLVPAFAGDTGEAHMQGVLAVLVTTPFWFAGFNAAAQAIGENARQMRLRGVGLALIGAILVSLLFYCLVIAAASMAAPREQILAHQLPAAGAFEHLFGSGFARIVLLAGLLGLVSTWNAVFFATTRVLGTLSDRGDLPAWVGRVGAGDAAGAAARGAVLIAAAAGVAGVLLGRPVIGPIVNASGTCLTALFILVSAVVLHLRRTQPDLERPYRVPGGPATAWAALLCSCVLFVLSLYLPFAEAGGIPVEWWILGGWAAIGGAAALLRLGKSNNFGDSDANAVRQTGTAR